MIQTGQARRFAFVTSTAADGRDVLVEGESGILAISPPWDMPKYEASKRRLTWGNGSIATLYSADCPERLRGPQHDAALVDELCAWSYPQAFDMLQFGLRLGTHPKMMIATTPKPIKIIRRLVADPSTAIVRGSTFENKNNLAPSFFRSVVSKFENTRLGQQEIFAEILDTADGCDSLDSTSPST